MRRAWLSILLLAPLGCRGQFDISQYLAGVDTGDSESNTEDDSSESMDSESMDSESEDTSTDSTDNETETDTDTEETTSNCASDQLELAGGCFGVLTIIETVVSPTDLALADFSDDGRIDLVLAGFELQLLLGKEGAMFEEAVPIGGAGGNAVAVGNVNGDGLPDIAAIGNVVDVRTASPGGVFLDSAIIPLAGLDGAFANLDGDNDADLLVSGTTLRVVISELGAWMLSTELFYAGESVRVADLDNDEDFDIVLAQPDSAQLALFANAGDGSFNSPMLLVLPLIRDVEITELDADPLPELLVLGNNSVTAYDVHMNLALTELSSHSVGQDPRRIAVAELDGDGLLDVATVNFGSDDVSILLRENGGFGSELRVPSQSNADDPTLIAAADLNNDGRAELIVAAPGNERVYVLGLIP